MDYAALKTEIDTGPLAAECVGQSDDNIAAILTTRATRQPKSGMSPPGRSLLN